MDDFADGEGIRARRRHSEADVTVRGDETMGHFRNVDNGQYIDVGFKPSATVRDRLREIAKSNGDPPIRVERFMGACRRSE